MALGIDPGVLAAYGGAMGAGLLHGLEPGHGWPLTVREAVRHERPMRFGALASLLLSAGHFISTLVVVLLFFLVAGWLGLLERPLYAVGGILLIGVAVYPYVARAVRRRLRGTRKEEAHQGERGQGGEHRHGGDHGHDQGHGRTDPRASLTSIFAAALVLGFVHEEEFALIGFVAAGANAVLVGVLYGISVTASILSVTALAIALAAKRGGGLDQRRLAALGHVSSAMMLLIGLYYLARAAGLA